MGSGNYRIRESRNKFLRELSTTPALRELYLYTDIHLDSLNSTHLNLFYSSLYRFTALTHLDLSAWPDLDKLFDSDLSRMSDGLLFLGLYHTPLTQWNCQINIHCKEISGCANGEQIVSTMQCYSKVGPYMDDLYSDLFHHISNKHISLPHDSIKKMAYLVLNSLDKYICKLPKSDCFPLEYKEIIPTLLTWTACLYTLLAELKPHITPNLITRSLTTCIVFLHKINVADILNQGVAVFTRNICLICSLLVHEGDYKNQSMGYIFCKFLLAVINISCENSAMLISTDHYLYRLLDPVLQILERFLLSKDPNQKEYIGTRLGGINSVVRLITLKLDEKKSDNQIRHASGALISLTYHSLSNCMELVQRLPCNLLIKMIEDYSDCSNRDIVGFIIASVENIAEFCPRREG